MRFSLTTNLLGTTFSKAMKGDNKRQRKSVFHTGNAFGKQKYKNAPPTSSVSIWVKRMNMTDYKEKTRVSHDGYTVTVPNIEGYIGGSAKILRPKAAEPEICDDYMTPLPGTSTDELRILSKEQTQKLLTDTTKDHNNMKICKNADFKIMERKKGLCWDWQVLCQNCNYMSANTKMYSELLTDGHTPGPRPAAPNYAFQQGLQETTTGNTKARLLLAATGIPPPARSGMQTRANYVGKKTVELNEQDMSHNLENLKAINEFRTGTNDNVVNIAMDGTFTSNSMGSRRKHGQNANQGILVATETMTDRRKIVAVHIENKLCYNGAWLRNRGYDVTCCGDHADCTANKPKCEPLSERSMGYEIGRKMAEHELLVKYATTDGDGQSAAGLQHALKTLLDPMWNVTRQADTIHRGEQQYRESLRASYSVDMFPGRTKLERDEEKRIFSLDIKERCHKIYKDLFHRHAGNRDRISKTLPNIVNALTECYSGNCSPKCRRRNICCDGGARNNWWVKSPTLKAYGLKRNVLHVTDNDKNIVREVIEMKLSVEAFEDMKQNFNTQKNEAINRGITARLPKNVNYSRNAPARVAATCHSINNKPANSLLQKLEYIGAPLSKGGKPAQSLVKMQHDIEYNKAYKKRKDVKARTAKACACAAVAYHRHKRIKRTTTDYAKGQLEPKLTVRARRRIVPKTVARPSARKKMPASNIDHSYCRPVTVSTSS